MTAIPPLASAPLCPPPVEASVPAAAAPSATSPHDAVAVSATPAPLHSPPDARLSAQAGRQCAVSTACSLAPGAITHVLYHAHCPDGFGAAWAAWSRLGARATYLPVSYDEPVPPLPADARVAVVDFSYPREVMLDLKSRVQGLVVLDHHESAQRDLAGLDFAHFDMGHSGARLSWDFFHPGAPVPDLVSYVEDRDLWRWALPQSHEFSTGLSSYPMDFGVWDGLARDTQSVIREGATITRYRDRLIAAVCDRAHLEEIDGYRVPVVNSPHELASDVCHELILHHPDAPFVASYFDDAQGVRQWELRSQGSFDVSRLAGRFGGGGHQHAAGFRQTAPHFQPPASA